MAGERTAGSDVIQSPSDREAHPQDRVPGSVIVRVHRVIADLIPGYLDARRVELDEMRDLIRDEDLDALRAIGHRLKGSGGGYGFQEITELGALIEEAAGAGDIEGVVVAVRRLDGYIAAVTFAVEE